MLAESVWHGVFWRSNPTHNSLFKLSRYYYFRNLKNKLKSDLGKVAITVLSVLLSFPGCVRVSPPKTMSYWAG